MRLRALTGLEREKLEAEFAQLQKDIEELNNKLLDIAGSGDGRKIADISKQIHDKQTKVDSHFEEMQTLSDDYDRIKASFDDELNRIDQGL